MPSRAASSLVILALAMAGCTSIAEGTTPLARPGVAGFDETTGSIVGLVVTPELEPIFDASATLQQLGASTRTDVTGRFHIGFVPPGDHGLVVEAPGFRPEMRIVTVLAGQSTEELLFTLIEEGRRLPYHATTIHSLIVSGYAVTAPRDCIYVNPTVKTCQATTTACQPNQCEVHYGHCGDGGAYTKWGCDFGQGWKTIIAELTSKPTSAVSGHGWSFTVLGPNVSRANGDSGQADNGEIRAWRVVSEAPIRTWIDEDVLRERKVEEKDWCGGINIAPGRCDWVWRLFPGPCELGCSFIGPNVGIMQEQRATIYFSYYMFEPAPPGWSAIPDS